MITVEPVECDFPGVTAQRVTVDRLHSYIEVTLVTGPFHLVMSEALWSAWPAWVNNEEVQLRWGRKR